MAAEIPIIIEAEFAPVVALLRWSQLDVQDWAHVKPINTNRTGEAKTQLLFAILATSRRRETQITKES